MNAREVKDALRRRHPATSEHMVGPWTVLEEVFEIDVLAIGANANPVNAARKVRYPRVGYEVKVSRGDMRSELLKPSKRRNARRLCSEFYFAVPRGLMKPGEIEFLEPEWEPEDFMRETCPAHCRRPRKRDLWGDEKPPKGTALYTEIAVRWPRQKGWPSGYPLYGWVDCETCDGKGYLSKSRVEVEAPTLWVPRDCGLIEVDGRGCHVVRKSPVQEPLPLNPYELGTLVRWASVRPDPRHERWWRPSDPSNTIRSDGTDTARRDVEDDGDRAPCGAG